MREGSPGINYNPIRGDADLSSRSPSGPRHLSPGLEKDQRPKSPIFARENSLSPGRKIRGGPRSPRRGRTPSPVRKDESRGRKSPLNERTRHSPVRSPPPDRRRSPVSDRGKRTPERTRSPRKSFNKSGVRSPDQSRSPHDLTRSGRRTRSPFNQRRSTERTRSPGRGTSPPSDRRRSPYRGRPRTPERRRPTTPVSPGRKGKAGSPRARSDYSPDGRKAGSPSSRRNRSPPYSPGRSSPDWRRRGPVSPGRPRYPRTPPYSPGYRPRSRSPYDRRRGDSPDRRRRYSPRRRQNVPDSTISDAELARQMPPPGHNYNKFRQLSPGYSDSPKRLSLDERLEREHGIKIDQDRLASLDFSRPPPSFPQPPGHFVAAVVPHQQPQQHHLPPLQPQPTNSSRTFNFSWSQGCGKIGCGFESFPQK